jgi:hypothetical protein
MDAVVPSFKYSDALVVHLAPSRRAGAFLVLASVATSALVARLPLEPVWQFVAIVAVLVLAGEALWSVAARRGRRGVRAARIDRFGAIEVRTANAAPRTGAVRPGSFVAPWLTIVRWRPRGGRFDRTFVVLPDMLEAEPFRHLRVLLKWGETADIITQ